jgi:uncharacterized protein
MNYDYQIAKELSLLEKQVGATISLLEEGGTIPFIARYRKEFTGGLDEVEIAGIRDGLKRLQELDKRKEAILTSLEEQNVLSADLRELIVKADTLSRLEDIYLPYKPKRKTRASVAREKGLEELANYLLEQKGENLFEFAEKFIDIEKKVENTDDALSGARDIVAEVIAENLEVRTKIRDLFLDAGKFYSKVIEGQEELGQKYKDYFDWREPVNGIASHRLLAMRRGEKEQFLSLELEVPSEEAIAIVDNLFIKASNEQAGQVRLAIEDSFKRLIRPSIETEIRLVTRQRADEEAIKVFAENVRQLLLEAPMGQKRIMALDPGYRTGCKLVCLDEQGKLLVNTTIFPHVGAAKKEEAAETIKSLVEKYKIEAIAIGNGTAGRETEAFVKKLGLVECSVVMVNESGASIYSASKVAREEFPDQDITVRGAVSIGRRLMDPLAELVKIDPKSIGVGQYQHDVDQNKLQSSLDDVVVSCVNSVGVSLNTASKEILSYVSGLGPSLAQNIIAYRNEHGAFKDRNQLKKVARLGDKAFEQSAGFLRIPDSENPLDSSAVHPERYELVNKMAKDIGCSVADLLKDENLRKKVSLKNYVDETIGLPTLTDIMAELSRPGRDPRKQFEYFAFTEGVNEISDLKAGMKLQGKVTNITNFGAFVDIGVHQDGLVHLSQLANHFVKDPNDIVRVNQTVEVTVTEVDVVRKRIALSMKTDEPKATGKERKSTRSDGRKASPKVGKAKTNYPAASQKKKEEFSSQENMESKLAALLKKFG